MYIFLFLAILFASLYSILLHDFPGNENGNIFKLNFYSSCVWVFLLLIVNRFTMQINLTVLIWGMLYGIVQALFIFFKAKAMSTGTVSITTLIGNSSLLVSLFVSLILWNEKVSFWDIIGLIVLCVGIVLSTYKNSCEQYSPKWKVYVVFFLLFAAGVGIVFKAFGKNVDTKYTGSMMLVSAIVMAILNLRYIIKNSDIKPRVDPLFPMRKFILYALGAGVLSCLYNRLNITTSCILDAIIFFPAFNGGTVILSSILSILIFKEKLKKRQIVGLVLGVIAICIIGVF